MIPFRACPFCDEQCRPKAANGCGAHCSSRCRCLKIYDKLEWECKCTPSITWHKCPGAPAPGGKTLCHSKERFESVGGEGAVFVKDERASRPFSKYGYYEAGPNHLCTWRPAVIIEGDADTRATLKQMLIDGEAYPYDLKPDESEPDQVHLVAVDPKRMRPTVSPHDKVTFVAIGNRVKDYQVRRLMVGDNPTPMDWTFKVLSPSATRKEVLDHLNIKKDFLVFC